MDTDMAILGSAFFPSNYLHARQCKACHLQLCMRSITPCARELAHILRVDAASLVVINRHESGLPYSC